MSGCLFDADQTKVYTLAVALVAVAEGASSKPSQKG